MLYLTRDPTPSTVFLRTSRVNGALTDLLFCVGRISSGSIDESERDVYRQLEAILSDSLLPQDTRWSTLKTA